MLTLIKETDNPLLEYVKDDPVRPELSKEFRVSNNKFVSTIIEEHTPDAMVCVSLHNFVPQSVEDLSADCDVPTTAIFYTIWSYKPGAAAKLLFQTVDTIKQQYPTVTRFVTLSPKTDMARKFHLKNGAYVFRENESTVNYEYLVS